MWDACAAYFLPASGLRIRDPLDHARYLAKTVTKRVTKLFNASLIALVYHGDLDPVNNLLSGKTFVH